MNQLNAIQSETIEFSRSSSPVITQHPTPPIESLLDPKMDTLITQFYKHIQSLLTVVRQAAAIVPSSSSQPRDATAILLPLKQILITCRSISETAQLPPPPPPPPPSSSTINMDDLLDTLDSRKQALSESLVLLMSATKAFALQDHDSQDPKSSSSGSLADVERECAGVCSDVDSIKAVLVMNTTNAQPSSATTTTVPPRQSPAPQFPESTTTTTTTTTRLWIQDKTNTTIQSIQGLLQVLRTITVETVQAGIVPTSIVPQILQITESVDELIGNSNSSVLARVAADNNTTSTTSTVITQESIEHIIFELDSAKNVLQDLGSKVFAGYRGGSGVNGWGESEEDGELEVKAVKHRIGTAAYALVKSMKEFCDLFGV
ncbi:hypothetical protein BDR26DRAFT_869958 [Obelidium mucronatum]|nr:hypothetical protein BDR26DRAFT_869958 [Obelidium mucronatum]